MTDTVRGGSRLVALVAAVLAALTLILVPGTSTAAAAPAFATSAEARSAVPATGIPTQVRAGGFEACVQAMSAIGGPAWGWVAAVLMGPYGCGSWVGRNMANAICWASRRPLPWSAYDRAKVRVLTGGRYTRC